MPNVFHLVYVSSAAVPFTPDQLVALLAEARANNERLGVTGMLLYKDGNFLQVLEGPEETVRPLYAQIAADPRHRGIIVLLEGEIPERQFGNWSMGFRNLASAEVTAMPGYSPFLERRLSADAFAANPSDAQSLLLLFRDSR